MPTDSAINLSSISETQTATDGGHFRLNFEEVKLLSRLLNKLPIYGQVLWNLQQKKL